MLHLACFVTVFLLPGPTVFGSLGKSPSERRFFKAIGVRPALGEHTGGVTCNKKALIIFSSLYGSRGRGP